LEALEQHLVLSTLSPLPGKAAQPIVLHGAVVPSPPPEGSGSSSAAATGHAILGHRGMAERVSPTVATTLFGPPILATPFTPVPRLVRAELFTHTNNDNKDHDTGIYLSVTTADGRTLLAGRSNADNSGDDSTEYNDYSDHTVPLTVLAPGAQKTQSGQFRVHLWQRTHGNDTWKFNAQVSLDFSDGTNLVASRDNIVLRNNNASIDFQAP
jgi:hypothetical protein